MTWVLVCGVLLVLSMLESAFGGFGLWCGLVVAFAAVLALENRRER